MDGLYQTSTIACLKEAYEELEWLLHVSQRCRIGMRRQLVNYCINNYILTQVSDQSSLRMVLRKIFVFKHSYSCFY